MPDPARADRPMRILTVGNRYPPASAGGYERLWAASVAALRDDGHTVQVLTTRGPAAVAGADPEPGVSRTLDWYWRDGAFPRLGPGAVVALERANARVFAAALREIRPHVVIWFAMGGMSLSLLGQARAAGLPQVAIVADDWLSYGPSVDGLTRRSPAWGRRPLGALTARMLGLGPGPGLRPAPRMAVSFISAFLREAAVASGGWRAAASVDHPGADPQRFRPAAAHPWNGRLLCCGRLDERKGVAVAIEALAALPESSLTVDGDGSPGERARLRTLAERCGVADRVVWQNSPADGLPAVYAAADAVLFPVTWPEPWGLVPLEAMAVGRPVVATCAGGVAEYLVAGGNALTVTAGDVAGLAAAAGRLATDPTLRERLVAGGRMTAARLTQAAWLDAVRGHVATVTG